MRKLVLVLLFASILLPVAAVAQDAVPGEILSRTFFIKLGNESGTAFAVDYDGKGFLITAKHVVEGVPAQNAVIQIWQDGKWQDYKTVKTIYPKSNDVDIAIFETKEKVPTPYGVTITQTAGPTLGQQVWFLGYPFGLSNHFEGGKIFPFIKRGTMSAIDAADKDAIVLYIDGFNNPGFSGGPIIYYGFSDHVYHILGVVQGYKEDSAKVLVNGQHVDTQLLVNTGILVGYSIDHAMQAIRDSEAQTTK
jgi:S1-C subfamily serine protease